MNQKLSDWASIAEIVSGFAVVVTLLLLFLGIRDSNQITRASMYSDVIDGLSEVTRDIYRDAELNRLWTRYLDGGELTSLNAEERSRLRTVAMTQFRAYDKAFLAAQNGVIGTSEWQRFEGPLCFFSGRLNDIGVNVLEADNFRAEFLEAISATCETLTE